MKTRLLTYLLILGGFVASCNPRKYVADNEFLLDENVFEINKDTSFALKGNEKIVEDELLSIVKQKPNRKLIFGIRFHLRLYSLSNENRIERRKLVKQRKADKKNAKIDKKNEKRLSKNEYAVLKQHVVPDNTFGEGLRNSGEAPVILDSLKVFKTTKQIGNYLINKGFFHNRVSDTIVYGKKQKAMVVYKVVTGIPFRIRSVNYEVADSLLMHEIDSIEKETLIRPGDKFDTDKLTNERIRITKHLLNRGYYSFNKEFIYFNVDSTIGKNQIDITLGVQNYKVQDVFTGEMAEVPHQKYTIEEIEIYADFQRNHDQQTKYATLEQNGVEIKHNKKLKVKPKLIYEALLVNEGELYNKSLTEATYRKMAALGVYKSVNIQFKELDTMKNGLAMKIFLSPSKSQSFNLASDGLNNEGLFGIEGSMTYAHRNLFGGAEKLQISFTGGIEAQRLVTDSANTNAGLTENLIDQNFNTIEFGPKVSLLFPRFLFLDKYFHESANAKTELSATYNYQRRTDFTRNVQDLGFTWIWHEKSPITYRFTPLSISVVNINKSLAFEDKIKSLNDRFLAASYDNSIIAGGKVAFEYNGQAVNKKRNNVFYANAAIEGAGNVLRTLYKLTDQPIDEVTGSYNLLNTRFAQFVKITTDLRYYRTVFKKSKLVYRFAGGFGVPMANLSEALPFQKSFYGGGANGMRAWKARTLGPGAYYDSIAAYDKIGDINLEGNMEFRFPISSWINGAWFVDAGNIWLLNKDSLRTNAHFDQKRFLDEIAIGSGLGLRLDLDFFIIRLDFSMPVKNPALPVGERWIFASPLTDKTTIRYPNGTELLVDRNRFFKVQFNLGIGYPF